MSITVLQDVVISSVFLYRDGMQRDQDDTRPATLSNDAWRGVLFATSRTLQAAEPDLIAKAGFPLTWLDVLAQLHDAGATGLRMQELEQRSLFTRSGLTRLVDRIEAAGLVRREAVPGDRRGVQVVLTEEGRRRHDAAFRDHNKFIERAFASRLSESQLRAVAEALATFWHDDERPVEGG
jgi:DNA-binding MarR family transcriptional regulator